MHSAAAKEYTWSKVKITQACPHLRVRYPEESDQAYDATLRAWLYGKLKYVLVCKENVCVCFSILPSLSCFVSCVQALAEVQALCGIATGISSRCRQMTSVIQVFAMSQPCT